MVLLTPSCWVEYGDRSVSHKGSGKKDPVAYTLHPPATVDLMLGMSSNHQSMRTDFGREELGVGPKNNKELRREALGAH